MLPHAPRDPSRAPVRLLVGPGVRAEGLARVLTAIGSTGGVDAHAFTDVAALEKFGAPRLLLVDADAVPIEDVGYVRRFLAAHPTIELVLIGNDPRARTVRALGSPRFTHWPPDIEELTALLDRAGAGTNASHTAARAGAATHTEAASRSRATPAGSGDADVDELEQVRAILEHGADPDADANDSARRAPREFPAAFDSGFPKDFPGEFAPDFSDESGSLAEVHDAAALAVDEDAGPAPIQADVAPGEADVAPSEAGAAPSEADVAPGEADLADALADSDAPVVGSPAIAAPPWWRAQVADLADAAQRIDLSVKMLAQAAPEIDEGDLDDARARLRELEAEVARLLQFTRTLGYVAAPPPAGSQTFDLGEIVHLFATGLAQSGPEAPRCQFKATPNATVRSDRQLLSQALDAVFFLVRCTARQGDLVRARVQVTEQDGGWVELDVDFPSGPLEGLVDDDIVAPYSLSDLFPDLGSNALAAATGIVAGQGGRLRLASRARGRMTWYLRLPHWTA